MGAGGDFARAHGLTLDARQVHGANAGAAPSARRAGGGSRGTVPFSSRERPWFSVQASEGKREGAVSETIS